ncbi:hypothetical protein BSIN_2313 [Burkholderia singularis]|uniref:Uncharacterized protein n=1 Tax=Burkholderia singularis TaxID=1503053 RepID=A0A238H1H8_9BURK|nr:hypothetical protein BSIN_2313 [Burkholderia singularis]
MRRRQRARRATRVSRWRSPPGDGERASLSRLRLSAAPGHASVAACG